MPTFYPIFTCVNPDPYSKYVSGSRRLPNTDPDPQHGQKQGAETFPPERERRHFTLASVTSFIYAHLTIPPSQFRETIRLFRHQKPTDWPALGGGGGGDKKITKYPIPNFSNSFFSCRNFLEFNIFPLFFWWGMHQFRGVVRQFMSPDYILYI